MSQDPRGGRNVPSGLGTKGRWILFAVAVTWSSEESQWLILSRVKCRWNMGKKDPPKPCKGLEALC